MTAATSIASEPPPRNLVADVGSSRIPKPMIRLDGLDIALVLALDASVAEHRPDRGAWPTTRAAGDAKHRWGRNLRPARREQRASAGNPFVIYPYSDWRESLEVLAKTTRHIRIMPISWSSSIRSTARTGNRHDFGIRQAGAEGLHNPPAAVIHVVVERRGTLTIDGQAHALVPGEIVVVPSWSERSFSVTKDLVVFSYADRGTQEKLNLWREALG